MSVADQPRRLQASLQHQEMVLFSVSACVVAYQIILVRSFSIGQWHHFAYMVISIALLGFGASGTLLAGISRRTISSISAVPLRASWQAWFVFSCSAFAIVLPASFWFAQRIPFEPFLILWDWRQLLYLGCFYFVLFVPFFAAASAIGLALTAEWRECPRLYAVNLAGSGAGALLAVSLLSAVSVEYAFLATVLLTQAAAGLALRDAAPSLRAGWQRLVAVLSVVMMAGLTVTYALRPPGIRLSQYKGLSYALNLPQARVVASRASALGRVDVVASPAIHEAPGLSLVAPIDALLPRQLGLYLDAETAGPITAFDGDISKLAYLDWSTTAAPYFALEASIRAPVVCVLGAGGGTGVLLALRHRAERVDAVELDPEVAELLHFPFRKFAGDIYDRPDVRLHRVDARSFVQATSRTWHVIDLRPTDSFAGSAVGAGAIGENYVYTREAFESYLRHLRPRGMLAITAWVRTPPRDELKIFATAVAALERLGLDPSDRLVLLRSWATVTSLVKRDPFTASEISSLRDWAEGRLFDTVYFPGITSDQHNRFNLLDRDYYFEAITSFLAGGDRREAYFGKYAFAVRPATDLRPYFSHFFRWRAFPLVLADFRRSSIPFSELGYLILIATLVQAMVLAVLLIVFPLFFLPRRTASAGLPAAALAPRKRAWPRVLICFSALGLGYLFVEMALIQRLVFFLANPVYAVAVVLAGLLLVSGLGSAWAAQHLRKGGSATRLACLAALVVAAASIVYDVGLYPILTPLLGWPLSARIILSLVIMLPLAAMGMPFPLLLRFVGQEHDELLPWAWSVNGCASVVAGPLATLLALSAGLPAVLLGASVCYFLTALTASTWESTSVSQPLGRRNETPGVHVRRHVLC